MISLVAQERLLGATLGSVLMGGVILEQRRGIHRSLSDSQYNTASKSQHFVIPSSRSLSRPDLAHLWNKTVDETLGPAIKCLSAHGW
ncbi:hypothetical protein ZOSMA_79G00600 [Zostera marina]|uniref:Uncharacterized protein n=1 Tax=Zostera marina TaxID=29655 RepID=A0A0K9NQ67_ZOSMR|nr:hypothetical protein ZOSMA_79G00600 [Zostera marina]